MQLKPYLLRILFVSLLFIQASVAGAQMMFKDAHIQRIYSLDSTVIITVVSEQPFYVGNNNYVLYAGDASFDYYEQSDLEGKGILRFMIPRDKYAAFEEGTPLFLTYGQLFSAGAGIAQKEQLCAATPQYARSLGPLDKSLLDR